MIYIGIDPGLSGAVGIISSPGMGNLCKILQVLDTPTALVEGEKTKRKYLAAAMALILEPFQGSECLVVLENVHSMPKQGVASSFNFGEGKGLWEGIIAAYKLPMELVSPQRWKKAIMVDQGKDKSAARFKAMALFPVLSQQLKLVKHDGRAEALLMAEYGRRLRKGQ